MGKPAARLGDSTMHGGTITVGFPMVLIGGMPAARLGDMHVCPMMTPGTPPIPHVGGPVVMGSPMVLIGGMPAARMGDPVVCVGPPDTIAMGCMTVLIGEGGAGSGSGGGAISSGAASAMAGALNAASGSIEASTKEEHWIEFEFQDKAGKPVTGVNYTLTGSDNKESESILKPDGRIIRDALPDGECKVILRDIFCPRWSKEKAKVGDKVKLSIKSLGVKDGTKVEFTVFMKDIHYNDQILEKIESEINGEKSEAEWELQVDEKFMNIAEKSRKEGGYSQPFFYFDAYCEGLISKSPLLYYEDWIELEFKDDSGKALADKKYRMVLSSGEVKEGKTDGSGKVKIEKIPPGIIDISMKP
jgi:uncharacterized Zn-binding protein involved in type VI secretion